ALQSDPARRPEPAQLLERLAALDLTYYDDPGDTELLGTGARTTVLPVSGAAAGAADDARSAEDEESEPAAPGEEDLAERTAVLPVQDSPPTQPIPAEQPTETLPRVTTAQEPVTETLPVTGAPTRALPVVPPQGGGPPVAGPAPARVPAPGPPPRALPVVPRRGGGPPVAGPAPAQPMPQQYAPVPAPQQYALAPAPHPYGDVRGADPRYQDPQAMVAHGGPVAWPAPPPRRPLLVWLGHLLIVSLAAVAPYMSLAVLLALGAMARTWERTHRSVSAQRMRGVTGSGPVWRAGLAGPFRALLGLLEIALQALLPLILG